MEKETFINELGNKILVRVKESNTKGVTCDGNCVKLDAVEILIRGPRSESSNTITWQEAHEIYKVLRRFLKKYG